MKKVYYKPLAVMKNNPFNQLHVRPFGKNTVKTTLPYAFMFEGKEYVIPKGFEFDGASIPRVFWSVIGTPFAPQHLEAALIHDWLIAKMIGTDKQQNTKFKQVLKNHSVSNIKASTLYSAVKLGRPLSRLWYSTFMK
jgi:hypothetical protein